MNGGVLVHSAYSNNSWRGKALSSSLKLEPFAEYLRENEFLRKTILACLMFIRDPYGFD